MKLETNTGLASEVLQEKLSSLIPHPNNPRMHSAEQIGLLANSISNLGLSRPVIIDELKTILLGHGCVEAVRRLGWTHIPTLMLRGLSAEKKQALLLADNHIATKASWDDALLKVNLEQLLRLDFDVELTGFSMPEIEIRLSAPALSEKSPEPPEDIEPSAAPVSKVGDVWVLGRHRLACGDALTSTPYHTLLGDERAQMVVTDAPYNVRIQGHARGRSKRKHREFAMASGEMSSPGFTGFLEQAMGRAIQFSEDGSIHYWFMDWRHLPELLRAGLPLYSSWKNLLVWRKSNAGQGSFYRSQHELIAVFKSGNSSHINNFGLGGEGRYRTNVLDYPGGATPDAKRQEELAMHPTVKPKALIADLMKDCSNRNGIVLDLFGGSGTTILAAEDTGRRARAIELDPLYVDLAIRRWQIQTGEKALQGESGRSFDEMMEQTRNG